MGVGLQSFLLHTILPADPTIICVLVSRVATCFFGTLAGLAMALPLIMVHRYWNNASRLQPLFFSSFVIAAAGMTMVHLSDFKLDFLRKDSYAPVEMSVVKVLLHVAEGLTYAGYGQVVVLLCLFSVSRQYCYQTISRFFPFFRRCIVFSGAFGIGLNTALMVASAVDIIPSLVFSDEEEGTEYNSGGSLALVVSRLTIMLAVWMQEKTTMDVAAGPPSTADNEKTKPLFHQEDYVDDDEMITLEYTVLC